MRPLLLLTGGLLTAVCLVGLAPAETAPAPRKVRIGLVETLGQGVPPAILAVVMRPFQALMEAQTGMTGDIAPGGDALTLARKLHDDEVQVGVFHGHEYAWAKAKYPRLRAAAVCVNRQAEVRVHLVVRADSKVRGVDDLRGKVVAVPRLNRAHCHIFFERRCVAKGANPAAFFRKVTDPPEAQDGLDDVVARDADATIVDAIALEDYRKAKPGPGRLLRTVLESEAFPGGVIAYYDGRFPNSTVRRFKVGLLTAKDTPKGQNVLRLLRLTAFEPPPENHDEALKAIAAAYPPPPPAK